MPRPLPVAVTGRQSITGGTEFTFDVYSSKQFGTLVYQGLRGVSVTGSVLGAPLNVGDHLTVLGFFSVNLKRALDALPTTANARYYWLLLAESHLTRRLFGAMLPADLGVAGAGGLTRDPLMEGIWRSKRSKSGQVSQRCPEVAWLPLSSRLESLRAGRLREREECDKMISPCV
jgi:hypothetical protein